MNVKDLLMPYEEYVKLDIRPAYVYTIKKDGQKLVYYGSTHSNDPIHPQFADIKRHWERFLTDTVGQNRVAMNEGGPRSIPSDDVSAVVSDAEAGLLTWLATAEAGVEIMSPEPNRNEEFEELSRTFTVDEIEYYYFARNIVQWHRKKGQSSFTDYMGRYFDRRRQQVADEAVLSVRSMTELHKRWFGGDLDKSHRDFFYSITNPCFLSTRINHVARDSSNVRDVHIVQQIKTAWDHGKSIFVVFGFSHAVIEEPALRLLLKEKAGKTEESFRHVA